MRVTRTLDAAGEVGVSVPERLHRPPSLHQLLLLSDASSARPRQRLQVLLSAFVINPAVVNTLTAGAMRHK